MSDTHIPPPGVRLKYNSHLGTVRYAGPVDGTNGIWIGVEWDDPSRGKHDGTKDRKSYFSCLVPGAGSFIRPSAAISYGTSFLTALAAKYNEQPHGTPLEKVVLGSSNGAIAVEAPGLDRIRRNLSRLESLREVSLDNEGVATADPAGSINKTCPGIHGLDLSKNLLPSWDTVLSICCELPHLQRLALNNNRLNPAKDKSLRANALSKLQELQLNASLTTWDELQDILSFTPRLELVEMGYNRLCSLDFSNTNIGEPQSLTSEGLKELNLDGNQLHSWADTCEALRACTGLQRLVLRSNGIANIDAYASDAPSPVRALRHLALSHNHLERWADLDHLARWCPALETLALTGNPLVEVPSTGTYARQFAIAKIPSLAVLDAAPISAKARTDSELFYLSYIVQHGPKDEETRRAEHPQWPALCAKHGAPDEAKASIGARQETLARHLIELHMHRITAIPSNTPADREIAKDGNTSLSVLPAMPIRAFRAKVSKIFKIPKAQQSHLRMWLQMPDGRLMELDSDDGARDLAWWGIESGSDIMVHFDMGE